MNYTDFPKIQKNSFSLATLIIGGFALFLEVLISLFPSQKQYFPLGLSEDTKGNNAKILGMEKYFFNIRKNITTNKLDYPSMLAADIADRAMSNTRKPHGVSVPAFNWISMGPTNSGGHTSSMLIDNTDLTHQTIFAAGMTGGVWKSTNGGTTWGNTTATISFSTEDTMANMNICCLAQDSKGALYAGTGDGFTVAGGAGSEYSDGELGGGIFKSTDDGRTWRLLPSTKPTPVDMWNVKWAYTNRIAIRPDSFQVIYAATNLGLMISHDSGATWNTALKSGVLTPLTGNSLDVKISIDGSVVVAFSGGYGWYCYPQSGNSNIFTQIPSAGAGSILGNASRIEFAISPTDANRIYACDVPPVGASNVFMTMTSKTNGGYWYNIGSGGGGDTYTNAMAVFPGNEAQILVGGPTLWEWSGANNSDTVGQWEKVTHFNSYFAGDPLWIHPNQHAIVFDLANPQTVYMGNDGGLFKCTNMLINPATPTISIANLSFSSINRNYNVTQYYSLCYSPIVNYEIVSYNNHAILEGLGLGGGTQGQGSLYINGTLGYPTDGLDLSGGDGAGAAVSQLNPNIAYFCSDYGALLKKSSLGSLAFPTNAYTTTTGNCMGGDIDSMWNGGISNSCFVFPIALYENPYDFLNHDSMLYVAQKNYAAGDTIWPISKNGNITYPDTLHVNLTSGDTLKVPDRVVSRLAVSFSGSGGGLWINGQGASLGTPIWMPIGGPLSQPDAFSDATPVHAIAWANDGNIIFAGCEDGGLYRLTNINSIIANNYCSGALWYNEGASIHATGNTNIHCTNLTDSATGIASLAGRNILSIATDPKNINNILVTAGNYGQTDFVYYCGNATAAHPSFIIAQGNLPAMPVYSSILDILDSNGNSIPNSAMIGTEHGIYTTTNITAGAGTVWIKNNEGMANVMTQAIAQQTTKPWLANNTGVIYAATHGRGLWASTNEYKIVASVPGITPKVALNNLLVYPNPSNGAFTFDFNTPVNGTLEIFDITGREVCKTTVQSTKTEINISRQTDGVYFYRAISNTGSIIGEGKIVKD